MKTKQRNSAVYVVFWLIPAAMVGGLIFHLSQAFIVPLVIFLGLVVGAAALWARANRSADGSEWWQDDDASGWRGY
jgi:membrane protein implicated in regulation of membrane protease activity